MVGSVPEMCTTNLKFNRVIFHFTFTCFLLMSNIWEFLNKQYMDNNISSLEVESIHVSPFCSSFLSILLYFCAFLNANEK